MNAPSATARNSQGVGSGISAESNDGVPQSPRLEFLLDIFIH
jgi:hypothetical protein